MKVLSKVLRVKALKRKDVVRERNLFWRIRGRLALIPLLAAVALPLFAAPASATYVWGGTMPIIRVETGTKNYSNHTQWVSSIYIDAGNRCDGGTAEAWVSRPGVIDWYASRQMCGNTMFFISRWVPSGSSVCGSDWFFANGKWWRGISCITITV